MGTMKCVDHTDPVHVDLKDAVFQLPQPDKSLMDLSELYDHLDTLTKLLEQVVEKPSSSPVVTVQVPDSPLAPVTVNLPEMQPQIHLSPTPVTVSLPELVNPVINVNQDQLVKSLNYLIATLLFGILVFVLTVAYLKG